MLSGFLLGLAHVDSPLKEFQAASVGCGYTDIY